MKILNKNVLKMLACASITLTATLSSSTFAKEKLDLSLSEHSQKKIFTLLNDSKTWDKFPKKITLCVYSPNGANGEAFEQATSYISELPRITQVAKSFGVNLDFQQINKLQMKVEAHYPKINKKSSTDIQLKVYTDERVLTEDFKNKRCDGAAISNIRARQFNSFVGSIDAIGAVTSYKQLTSIIQLLARSEFDSKMINKDYEVVGIVPLGAAYIMVTDRKINSMAKAAGKRVAVFQFDQTQQKMVQNVGAQPVLVDLTSVGGKFNNKEVDIMASPALLFEPLELHRGMTDKSGNATGGIIRFPLVQVTGTLIMHRDKFPVGMGSIAREIISKQLQPAFDFVDKTEKNIPAKFWIELHPSDKPGYTKMMREARLEMTKLGLYNKEMMTLLKKVRCSQEPSNYECALKDE